MNKALALSAASALLATAVPATAAKLKYALEGPDKVVFYLNQEQKPDHFTMSRFAHTFGYVGVNGSIALEDGAIVDTNYNIDFYGAFNGGGLTILTSDYDPRYGWEENYYLTLITDIVPTADQFQLYSRKPDNPFLLTGVFTLKPFDIFSEETTTTYTLTISAVPEPATWALMILGFGAVGGAMRRRRRAVAPAVPA